MKRQVLLIMELVLVFHAACFVVLLKEWMFGSSRLDTDPFALSAWYYLLKALWHPGVFANPTTPVPFRMRTSDSVCELPLGLQRDECFPAEVLDRLRRLCQSAEVEKPDLEPFLTAEFLGRLRAVRKGELSVLEVAVSETVFKQLASKGPA